MSIHPISNPSATLPQDHTSVQSPANKKSADSENRIARILCHKLFDSDPIWKPKSTVLYQQTKAPSEITLSRKEESQLLIRLREESGCVQQQLSQYFGCHSAHWCNLERGNRFISIVRKSKLRDFFEKYHLSSRTDANFKEAVKELATHKTDPLVKKPAKKHKEKVVESDKDCHSANSSESETEERASSAPPGSTDFSPTPPIPSPVPPSTPVVKSYPEYLFNRRILEQSVFIKI